jgi:hypothetical protein
MARKTLSIDCEYLLNDCKDDFKNIEQIIKTVGKTSNEIPYLTRYALIKSHGTIEQCYKNIVADFCEPGSTRQMKYFFERNFRNRAAKLKFDNICNDLRYFDQNWPHSFKKEMKKFTKNKKEITTSVSSLIDARNQFAHGSNPQITFRDIKNYFLDSEKMIRSLNRVIK